MVANDAGFATLAAFQASELLGFAMKLLDLPAYATRVLCGLRVILSQVVGDDIVRALWRQHHPEQFHLVFFGEALDLDQLAVYAAPNQTRPASPPADREQQPPESSTWRLSLSGQ